MQNFLLISLILAGSLILSTRAWDAEEMEIFDLVEEINKNFYEFMGIGQNATNNEIKRAFRGLSIVLHPDKSTAEDANIQFRNLVSIYEVLRDPGKREKYNKVLRDGLPNWKSALYYYRRMRKIGIYELLLLLFVLTTIGQYVFAWAAFIEKKYTAEQVFGSKLKKLQKKNKNVDLDTILSEIPKPSILNTLPFQIPRAIWNLPKTIKNAYLGAAELKELALENMRREAEEAKRIEELEKEQEELVRLRKEKKEHLRKRKIELAKAPEKTDEELQGYSRIHGREFTNDVNGAIKPMIPQKTTVSGGFWTDEDLTELIRLVKKYPGGSRSRWETIADAMNRSVQEVTFMAGKMKENGYRLPGHTDGNAAEINQSLNPEITQKKEKAKIRSDKNLIIAENNWSQEQQRALETAIVKYRKNATEDRWQKIANCVPEKTKEECLSRYKYLCELVKSQKKTDDEQEGGEDQPKGEQQVNDNVSIENDDEEARDEEDVEDHNNAQKDSVATSSEKGKRRNKRKERRRRREFSSDEDSDDAYRYEIS